jgi:caspase domain-containing protein
VPVNRTSIVAVLFVCLMSCALMIGSSARAQDPARQLQRQTQPIGVLPSKSKRWALIVGVDQYRDAQIGSLRGSVNDAHALANALVTYAGFPQDQVIVLTTDNAEERQPTRINILTYLSNLASLVPKDGLFLFSFAGHGIERGGQAFLIPSDARWTRDVSLLEESAVSVTRVHDRIKSIGVGQVIVLLDACRNDPGGRADAPNNMGAAYTKFNFDVRNREVEAFATLYATAVGQRAYEYTEKKQGYFTWAIVEALKGAAANDTGEVTLSALLKFVQETVPKRIAIDLGTAEQQKPFATIEGYRADELVIAVATKKPGKPSGQLPAQPSASAEPDLVIWEAIKNSTNPQDFQEYIKQFPNGKFVTQAFQRLATLQSKEAKGQADDDNPGPSTRKSGSVNILSAHVMYFSKYQPVVLSVTGTGWDGGSDIKIVVNGKDVSAWINNQTAIYVRIQGTIQELNLQDGKNEVFVIVNGATSNTSEFKLFRPPGR